jgi:hypothetical protein
MLIKIQPDATVCRYLFTAKSIYMFRVSQHPSSGVLKTVTAASGTGHNTVTANSLQRGPIGPRWSEVSGGVDWCGIRMQAEALVLQPASGYHTTQAKPKRNTKTHRTRAIQSMK